MLATNPSLLPMSLVDNRWRRRCSPAEKRTGIHIDTPSLRLMIHFDRAAGLVDVASDRWMVLWLTNERADWLGETKKEISLRVSTGLTKESLINILPCINLSEKLSLWSEMSKKFGINSKAAEARARQDAVKQTNDREKQQRLEDEYWKDDDKQVQKKQQRKVCPSWLWRGERCFSSSFPGRSREERHGETSTETRESETTGRRASSVGRSEIEEDCRSSSEESDPSTDSTKTNATRQQCFSPWSDLLSSVGRKVHLRRLCVLAVKQRIVNEDDFDLEENINHLQIDGASARNVEQAISVLQWVVDLSSDRRHLCSLLEQIFWQRIDRQSSGETNESSVSNIRRRESSQTETRTSKFTSLAIETTLEERMDEITRQPLQQTQQTIQSLSAEDSRRRRRRR